jgi:hypothetical protein
MVINRTSKVVNRTFMIVDSTSKVVNCTFIVIDSSFIVRLITL